jgi:prevent-host-death family protein
MTGRSLERLSLPDAGVYMLKCTLQREGGMKATAKDLRLRSSQLLEAVDRGEEVLITYRGRPRARLVPVSARERGGPRRETGLFGLWRDHEGFEDVGADVRELRRPRF